MAVIKEIVDGKCVVRIHDDYVKTDPKEVNEIIDRVSRLIVQCKIRQSREQENKEGTA